MIGLSLVVLLSSFAAAGPISSSRIDDPIDFALTLYREVAKKSPGANVLVSPYSAREAVGLAYIGARGATADGLAQALSTGSTEDFLISAKKARREVRNADPSGAFGTANSLWLRADWRFLGSYVTRAQENFDADVFNRDFSPRTVSEADAWVSRRTHGAITRAVEKLDPLDVAILLNAVYFKGSWKRPFDPKHTRDHDFRLASGEIVKRPRMMMFGRPEPGESAKFDYTENADMQAVRLRYRFGRLAMIVILPAKNTTLKSVADKFNGNTWRSMRDHLKPSTVVVELPRFKYSTSMRLNDALINMGAAIAFDAHRADFQDMAEMRRSDDRLHISAAQQTATIDVDETGTVAAAKTSAILQTKGDERYMGPTPINFIVDRPFLFAIEDTASGTLLFIGSVQDPH
jgi:serpin B